MILVVCTDDPKLMTVAQKSAQKNPKIFGNVYQAFKDKVPAIGANENLFVIAHGAFKDAKTGGPVIGDKEQDFIVDGAELWENIKGIFPENYKANIYIDACESADKDEYVISFIELFFTRINIQLNTSMVYGRNGTSSGLIAVPTDKGWVSAASKRSAKVISADMAATDDGDGSDNTTKVEVPQPDPFNIQATKYYTFNQTGNIMMSTTQLDTSEITQSVRDVFAEVSVFFAAMTKAISTSINPVTNKPYSLYDYNALEQVIDGSGLFIHVTEEDLKYTTESVGLDFSKDLIEGVLGLATGTGALSFASAMISSMGSAGLQIHQESSSSDSKVANIIFVCEYLLGMPMVSAIVVYADMTKNYQSFQLGPCFKESSSQTTLYMHKDTYMFVTPTFIKQYAGDLLSAENDPQYAELVNDLKSYLANSIVVNGVKTTGNNPVEAPAALPESTSFQVIGVNFGSTTGTLKMGSVALTVTAWTDTAITFTSPASAIGTSVTIDVFMPGNTGTTPNVSSPDKYTVA
jgi:hypothetical protein